MGIINFFKRCCCGFECSIGSIVLLAMRLFWGYKFFQAGWGKLGTIDNVTTFFESLNIMYPHYMAWLVAIVETGGGLLLMAGLFSRLAALPLAVTMITAYFTAHYDAVAGIFSNPEAFMDQAPFMFLLTALLVFAFGPGWFSLDHYFFGKNCCGKSSCGKGGCSTGVSEEQ